MRSCAAALALIATLATAASARAAAEVTGVREVKDRVVELTIATDAFAAPTKVEVVLPAGYDAQPNRRWPVTYFTAGTMNSQATFRTLIDGVGLTKDYPSLVVSPDSNSGYWSDWYNAGAFGPPKYESFVIDQLIPLIDARFRTIPRRSQRVIFGASMGGYGAMMLASHHPELFAAAASMSGAVDSNLEPNGSVLTLSSTFDGAPADAIYGPRAEQEVRWRGHNPWDLAENLRGLDLQVRTANGTPAPGIGENPLSADSISCAVELGVYQASRSYHARLDALGIAHEYKDYGPGCHTPANFTRETADILAHFEKVLTDPPAAPTRFVHRSIDQDFSAYGWRVQADPQRALEFMELTASRAGAGLAGSGTTTVTTPPFYRGLKLVDVGSEPVAVEQSRVRFTVDLGPAHTVQQYTSGGATEFGRRSVALAPHAVIRITKVRRDRLCARALGGTVRARVRGVRMLLAAKPRCRRVRGLRRGAPVTIRGRDAFGHRVKASRR